MYPSRVKFSAINITFHILALCLISLRRPGTNLELKLTRIRYYSWTRHGARQVKIQSRASEDCHYQSNFFLHLTYILCQQFMLSWTFLDLLLINLFF